MFSRDLGSRMFRAVCRRRRALLLAAATMPIMQATGCFPDPIGALNIQLQLLVNTTIITAINTIVQNLLGL